MKPLIISAGDPAGIGPEIVFRALARLDLAAPVRIVCDWSLTRQSLEACGIAPGDPPVYGPGQEPDADERLAILDVATSRGATLVPGRHDDATGLAALRSIERAAALAESGEARVLVTAPIAKSAIRPVHPGFSGHTELLASRSRLEKYGRDFAMFFDSPTLRVVLLTVHEPLATAIGMITPESIIDLARLTTRELDRLDGKPPRLGVAALNPHAGEGGAFGREDELIAEGVEAARKEGLDVAGPFAADTIFHSARSGRFDVVMAMYHDQGLIPVKTLHFEQSVNVTLGLPYLRVSPDHGTASDIAGKGIADDGPMRHAIEWGITRTR